MIVIFLISPLACVIAISAELALYLFLRRRALRRRWGDARAGVWMALARFSLLRLKGHTDDPRNWRPNALVFAGDPEKRIGLVRLANWFSQGRGIVTASHLIEGDLSIPEIIRGRSAGASIVFMGMKAPPPGSESGYAQRLDELASGLCTTAFVHNAGKFADKLI